MTNETIFFSYSRDNSDFVLQLAKDLREAGANIWLDQLDIAPGTHWDSSIETALQDAGILLVILSKSSVESNNVMDEVSFALEKDKKVVPVLLEECEIPFRLGRLQYADFTKDRETGLETLVQTLSLDSEVATKLGVKKKEKPTPPPKPKPQPITEQEFGRQAPVEVKRTYEPSSAFNPPPPPRKSKSWMPLVVLLLLAGVVAGLWYTGVVDFNKIISDLKGENKDFWKVTADMDTEDAYLNYIGKYGMEDVHYADAIEKLKSKYNSSGYIQYSDSDGVTRYFDKVSGNGENGSPAENDILVATDDRSVRKGVIGVDEVVERNGDVIPTGNHVIVSDVVMSGTSIWIKIMY